MIPNIISQNPFRVLGVYANSPKKDIVANKGKATAFLKVNRPVEYPLDLKGILPPLTRTLDSMNEAEAHLAIAKEQIKYAQFWFIKITPIDDIAFNHLLAGNLESAKDIWSKQENVSSLQNKLVCYLIENNLSLAIATAELLYGRFGDIYIGKIDANCTLQMSATELLHQFIDSLGDEVGMSKLVGLELDLDTKDYISSQAIGPLIKKISSEVDKTKKVDHKDPNARINAARILVTNTKEYFSQLKSILSASDPQFQMIADKLGLEILQCGIDYFNKSSDSGKHQTAMKMQKYALSVVVGSLAKQRCEENVDILQKIIDKLPPKEVMAEDKAIKAEISNFVKLPNIISSSIQLIKGCAPHIVIIKEKLGNAHQYYLKISTAIINNALGNIIAEVNEAQEADFITLKNTLISAWRTQLYMDKFDLDPVYKEGRYKECREALHRIISNCKGFDDSVFSFMYQYGCGWCNDLDVSDVDLRTEEEYYQSCRNIASYRSYLKRFPSGKYVIQAESKIEILAFQTAKTAAALEKFISDYPNSDLVTKAQEELKRIKKEEDERRARIEKQEKSIISCRTTDEVVSLYNKEKSNNIDIEKCSLRSFELANSEEDYRKVTSIFGIRTSGGKKAKTKLDEIEKKRKKAAENRRLIKVWSLVIIILLLILLCIYLIWGLKGLSVTCYIFTFIFGFIALGGIGSKEGEGCLIGIVLGLIAFGLGSLGGYLKDLSKEEKNQEIECVTSNTKSNNSYHETSSTNNDESNKLDNADADYDTYINNQLETGSKPYKDYYRSRTGENYLDFKTSGNDYVIIVRDYASSEVVNHIYIRAGDNGRLYLPDGTYNIYFYGGKGWNPNMDNGNVTGGFVSGGHVQKDGPVELYNQYGEYTLYPVQNGNLQLQGASKGEAL